MMHNACIVPGPSDCSDSAFAGDKVDLTWHMQCDLQHEELESSLKYKRGGRSNRQCHQHG